MIPILYMPNNNKITAYELVLPPRSANRYFTTTKFEKNTDIEKNKSEILFFTNIMLCEFWFHYQIMSSTGRFSDEWQLPNVTPDYRSGDRTCRLNINVSIIVKVGMWGNRFVFSFELHTRRLMIFPFFDTFHIIRLVEVPIIRFCFSDDFIVGANQSPSCLKH